MDVHGYGLRVTVPEGWHGVASQRSPQDAAVLQAATVPIADGDDTGRRTHSSMGAKDIYIKVADIGAPPAHLLERDPAWSSGPALIRDVDLTTTFEGVELPVYGMRSVVMNGRAIMFFVGFGSEPSNGQLGRANAVLATLRVGSG
jgi:hypothetical protein